ncbi:MAG: GerMN domain-containing protein [Acidobacteriaceae bacterium]
MISRAHKVLFGLLLLACVAMAAVLIRLRNRAQDRLQEQAAGAPAMQPAAGVPTTQVTLYVPNDLDDSLVAVHQTLALPQDESAEARELLTNLVAAYRAAGSTHPMNVASGVNQVYLLPVPQATGAAGNPGQLAIVDLSAALATAQPSGIEPETLTLLSMMATLHANMPGITEVHFLVDGQPRATLAGHADLTRTYLASEANPTPNPEATEGAP